jgi:signal transduction histidine kinase
MAYRCPNRLDLAGVRSWIRERGNTLVIAGILCWLSVLLACGTASASPPSPRSILILDQSISFRPWPAAVIAGLRSVLKDDGGQPISLYVEHLDLYRFGGVLYEESFQNHFREKYRDRPIGVIVVIGPTTLDYATRLRAALWPTVPIVFGAVDAGTAMRSLPPLVTGTATPMTLADMIRAARIVVPGLQGFAIVGDRWEDQGYFRHFAEELPVFSEGLDYIDVMGLSLSEVRQRVAALPDHVAILYLGINFDVEDTYVAADVLPSIAEVANRPIIVGVETFLGSGAVGGFIMTPAQIGQDTGRLALRVLNGESASDILITTGNALKPIFDWRQLQRWNIGVSQLPAGSELRFHEPSGWDLYRGQILMAVAVVLFQAALIAWLLFEHRRRHDGEIVIRNMTSELSHMNRLATAGELSAAIAHEVNQPLTGIVTKASAALRWLTGETPNVEKAKAALAQIVSAGHRASDIVVGVRAMFTRDPQQKTLVNMNELIRTVLRIVWIDLRKHNIELETEFKGETPDVVGNPVQLQQVILNLVMNAIEAMHSVQRRALRVSIEQVAPDVVRVSIEDSGTGIAASDLDHIFRPLFSTKARGMGIGLSICRSIVESHDGKIWVTAGVNGGSIFHVELPTINRGV